MLKVPKTCLKEGRLKFLTFWREPSGIVASPGGRRTKPFEVHARVRVDAGDEKGRQQLCRYVLRPPFADASYCFTSLCVRNI